MTASRKKSDKIGGVGKLLQVVGWMSEADKKRFVEALRKHPFIDGQSDFIKLAAKALISHDEKKSGTALAQPLCFLTVEQRDALIELKAKKKT